MKNVLIGQSGGPTAVINSSLCGAAEKALSSGPSVGTVFGMINGIEGFLQDQVLDLGFLNQPKLRSLLKTTPGAYLGSCRFRLPDHLTAEIYPLIFQKLKEYGIGFFLYIGGNDSMDTVSKLSAYAKAAGSDIRIIGIPKTIDNDLFGTDHAPGYGSAAKYVASTVRSIMLDASVYAQPSVTIIEIMGRHAGWLTAASVLARFPEETVPLLIYLPETGFCPDSFLSSVKEALSASRTVVVCVSEGIRNADGTFLCEQLGNTRADTFGHKNLSGSGKVLERLLSEKLSVKARSVELNICQRCMAPLLSQTDLEEAYSAGAYGASAALAGKTGEMVILNRTDAPVYSVSYAAAPAAGICNKEKTVPLQWIKEDTASVSDDFVRYLSPLIQGDVELPTEHGLPRFLWRTR